MRFMMQKVNVTTHNGIPTYWLDHPGGMSIGTLMFRVGIRDEPVMLAGITHLVEHLVLRGVEPVTIRNGARVDTNTVEFHASGKPDAVADFFNRVAAVLADFSELTEEDLALEKGLIQA
jgi:predicted Zn-dependent peptidase